jgi:hypothetical protein
MQIVRVQGNLEGNLHWAIMQTKSGAWVGINEPLKLTVQSETFAELMEDIGLTLDSLLRDLLISNELPQFLHDRGWQLARSISTLYTRPEEVRFDVPFTFSPVTAGTDGPQRHVHQ